MANCWENRWTCLKWLMAILGVVIAGYWVMHCRDLGALKETDDTIQKYVTEKGKERDRQFEAIHEDIKALSIQAATNGTKLNMIGNALGLRMDLAPTALGMRGEEGQTTP
jgi:hypothetical protein